VAEVEVGAGGRATLLFQADRGKENYANVAQLGRRLFEVKDDFDPVRAGAGCETMVNLVTNCRVPADATSVRVVIRLGARHDELAASTKGARFVVHGGDGADLFGGLLGAYPGRSLIDGGRGDDQLVGGNRADLIRGGEGEDILRGVAGDDVLQPGRGRDRVFPGDGADRIDLRDDSVDTLRCGRDRDRALLDPRDRLLARDGCERVVAS
jgi:Ca2+-binding RTX toxin-like protein